MSITTIRLKSLTLIRAIVTAELIAGMCFYDIPDASAEGYETRTPYSIVNSDISEIDIAVPAGTTLSISNSGICEHSTRDCVIVVEDGGRLDVKNSRLGRRVTIFYEGTYDESIDMQNAEIALQIRQGLPKGYRHSIARFWPDAAETKQLTNSRLDPFSAVIPRFSILRFVNSDICRNESRGEECRITLDEGVQFSAANSTFGKRVVIVHSDPYLSRARMLNVQLQARVESGDEIIAMRRARTNLSGNASILSAFSHRQIRAKPSERGIVISIPEIYFQFDRSDLTRKGFFDIKTISRILKSVPERKLLIEGHTDDIGSDYYNDGLSVRRAHTVYDALILSGIDGSLLAVRGRGKRRPITDNGTATGRAQNRRVEIILENPE